MGDGGWKIVRRRWDGGRGVQGKGSGTGTGTGTGTYTVRKFIHQTIPSSHPQLSPPPTPQKSLARVCLRGMNPTHLPISLACISTPPTVPNLSPFSPPFPLILPLFPLPLILPPSNFLLPEVRSWDAGDVYGFRLARMAPGRVVEEGWGWFCEGGEGSEGAVVRLCGGDGEEEMGLMGVRVGLAGRVGCGKREGGRGEKGNGCDGYLGAGRREMGGEDLDGRVGLEGLGVLRGSCAGEVEGGSGRGWRRRARGDTGGHGKGWRGERGDKVSGLETKRED